MKKKKKKKLHSAESRWVQGPPVLIVKDSLPNLHNTK